MAVKENNGETYISAPQYSPKEDSWVPGSIQDQGWKIGFKEAKSQGAKAPDCLTNPGFGFTRDSRLRKRPEFIKVFRQGKRYIGAGIYIYYLANDLGRSRIGLDVGRKAGNAVKRNRYKRLLREVFRRHGFCLAMDLDMVIRVSPGANAMEYRNILRDFLDFADKTAG